jgi:hypothetical protein
MSDRHPNRPTGRPPTGDPFAGLSVPAPPAALRDRVLAAALAAGGRAEAEAETEESKELGGERGALPGEGRAAGPGLVDRLWGSRALWLGWAAAVMLLVVLNAGYGHPASGVSPAVERQAVSAPDAGEPTRRTLGEEMARFGLPTPRLGRPTPNPEAAS